MFSDLFTLYAMETISQVKTIIHTIIRDQLTVIEKFLKDGADFEKWKSDPFIALSVYGQHAREFGWESYRKVFRQYEAMGESEKITDNLNKIDTGFSIF